MRLQFAEPIMGGREPYYKENAMFELPGIHREGSDGTRWVHAVAGEDLLEGDICLIVLVGKIPTIYKAQLDLLNNSREGVVCIQTFSGGEWGWFALRGYDLPVRVGALCEDGRPYYYMTTTPGMIDDSLTDRGDLPKIEGIVTSESESTGNPGVVMAAVTGIRFMPRTGHELYDLRPVTFLDALGDNAAKNAAEMNRFALTGNMRLPAGEEYLVGDSLQMFGAGIAGGVIGKQRTRLRFTDPTKPALILAGNQNDFSHLLINFEGDVSNQPNAIGIAAYDLRGSTFTKVVMNNVHRGFYVPQEDDPAGSTIPTNIQQSNQNTFWGNTLIGVRVENFHFIALDLDSWDGASTPNTWITPYINNNTPDGPIQATRAINMKTTAGDTFIEAHIERIAFTETLILCGADVRTLKFIGGHIEGVVPMANNKALFGTLGNTRVKAINLDIDFLEIEDTNGVTDFYLASLGLKSSMTFDGLYTKDNTLTNASWKAGIATGGAASTLRLRVNDPNVDVLDLSATGENLNGIVGQASFLEVNT